VHRNRAGSSIEARGRRGLKGSLRHELFENDPNLSGSRETFPVLMLTLNDEQGGDYVRRRGVQKKGVHEVPCVCTSYV
jgi:hypothetical protein